MNLRITYEETTRRVAVLTIPEGADPAAYVNLAMSGGAGYVESRTEPAIVAAERLENGT